MPTSETDSPVYRADVAATPDYPQARPVKRAGHPLGPLWAMVPLESRVGSRLYAAGLLIAVIAVFAVAARLHPNGTYQGTHQQLGLPPCGFVVVTGLPCPSCGMTTAFAYTIRGQVLHALHAQIAGFLLAACTLAAGVFAAIAVVTGRRPALNWYRISPTRTVWIGCGLFVAAWSVKIVTWLLENGSGRSG
jgi:hypothetical protein